MLTSHYGPRQGIYLPMEAFIPGEWKGYKNNDNGRVSMPLKSAGISSYKNNMTRTSMPSNSFPVRNLFKGQKYWSMLQHPIPKPSPKKISFSVAMQAVSFQPQLSTPPSQVSSEKESDTASTKWRSASSLPKLNKAASGSHKSAPSYNKNTNNSPLPSKPSPPHTSNNQTSFFDYLTTGSATMHSRYSKSVSTNPPVTVKRTTTFHFSYPDPLKMSGNPPSFNARLAELTRLQNETVKLEQSMGRFGSQGVAGRPFSALVGSSCNSSVKSLETSPEKSSNKEVVSKSAKRTIGNADNIGSKESRNKATDLDKTFILVKSAAGDTRMKNRTKTANCNLRTSESNSQSVGKFSPIVRTGSHSQPNLANFVLEEKTSCTPLEEITSDLGLSLESLNMVEDALPDAAEPGTSTGKYPAITHEEHTPTRRRIIYKHVRHLTKSSSSSNLSLGTPKRTLRKKRKVKSAKTK